MSSSSSPPVGGGGGRRGGGPPVWVVVLTLLVLTARLTEAAQNLRQILADSGQNEKPITTTINDGIDDVVDEATPKSNEIVDDTADPAGVSSSIDKTVSNNLRRLAGEQSTTDDRNADDEVEPDFGYWLTPIAALGLTCGGTNIKSRDGQYVCIKAGEALCHDNDGGPFGRWTFGIIEENGQSTVNLWTPKNEVAWTFCTDVTHVCIGEERDPRPNKFSNERPYLYFYDEKTQQTVGNLTCDGTDGFNGENLGKPTILKMVDNSDVGMYANYNVTVLKFKKGQTPDPGDSNELFNITVDKVGQDMVGFMSFKDSKCTWTDTCQRNPQTINVPFVDPSTSLPDAKTNSLPFQFAVPNAVDVSFPDGWTILSEEDGTRFSLRVRSAGATSLNFHFSRYQMPNGGTLSFFDTPTNVLFYRTFTALDNSITGELWTPVMSTDDVTIQVFLPGETRSQIDLALSSVNVGFRGFEEEIEENSRRLRAGSCNVNVVCPEGDDWRDEIPSVGLMAISGTAFCTGTLVNNHARDRRPFFLTAHHCSRNNIGTATMPVYVYLEEKLARETVVHWNYETSRCKRRRARKRQFTPAGGQLRAFFQDADHLLFELSSAPDVDFGINYAGWDARNVSSLPNATCIHHPDGDVKKISMENDEITGNDAFWRVDDWDSGTTEPGSSGSALWNPEQRIVGVLHGGEAACGNDLYDKFGKLSVAFTGDGTDAGSLRPWLAGNSGAVYVDMLSEIYRNDFETINPDLPTQVPQCSGSAFFDINALYTPTGIPPGFPFEEKPGTNFEALILNGMIDGNFIFAQIDIDDGITSGEYALGGFSTDYIGADGVPKEDALALKNIPIDTPYVEVSVKLAAANLPESECGGSFPYEEGVNYQAQLSVSLIDRNRIDWDNIVIIDKCIITGKNIDGSYLATPPEYILDWNRDSCFLDAEGITDGNGSLLFSFIGAAPYQAFDNLVVIEKQFRRNAIYENDFETINPDLPTQVPQCSGSAFFDINALYTPTGIPPGFPFEEKPGTNFEALILNGMIDGNFIFTEISYEDDGITSGEYALGGFSTDYIGADGVPKEDALALKNIPIDTPYVEVSVKLAAANLPESECGGPFPYEEGVNYQAQLSVSLIDRNRIDWDNLDDIPILDSCLMTGNIIDGGNVDGSAEIALDFKKEKCVFSTAGLTNTRGTFLFEFKGAAPYQTFDNLVVTGLSDAEFPGECDSTFSPISPTCYSNDPTSPFCQLNACIPCYEFIGSPYSLCNDLLGTLFPGGPGGYCDTSTGECVETIPPLPVECDSSSSLLDPACYWSDPASPFCIDDICIPCYEYEDDPDALCAELIDTGSVCDRSSGECIEPTPPPLSGECDSSENGPYDPICYLTDPGTPFCDNDLCVPCYEYSNTGACETLFGGRAPYCDATTGECVGCLGDNYCPQNRRCVGGRCVLRKGNPRFTLTWNGIDDLDLHVILPNGQEIYHDNVIDLETGAELDSDVVPASRATWTENILVPNGEDGVYTVWINQFSGSGDSFSLVIAEDATDTNPGKIIYEYDSDGLQDGENTPFFLYLKPSGAVAFNEVADEHDLNGPNDYDEDGNLVANHLEGDMLVTFSQAADMYGIEDATELQNSGFVFLPEDNDEDSGINRAIVHDTKRRWPEDNRDENAAILVPYEFGDDLDAAKQAIIEEGMKLVEEAKVIRFINAAEFEKHVKEVEAKGKESKLKKHFIQFFRQDEVPDKDDPTKMKDFCANSKIGFYKDKKCKCKSQTDCTCQNIKLGYKSAGICGYNAGSVAHEILHALGFYHEQSRSDRDEYVDIKFENIVGMKDNINFKMQSDSVSLGSPYDYGSITHYKRVAYRTDDAKKKKLLSIEIIPAKAYKPFKTRPSLLGQRDGLSNTDLQQLRLLYQCSTGAKNVKEITKCSKECPCWENAPFKCEKNDECHDGLVCAERVEKLKGRLEPFCAGSKNSQLDGCNVRTPPQPDMICVTPDPSEAPSPMPSSEPSSEPSPVPSPEDTISPRPSATPSSSPSSTPSVSAMPSDTPSSFPSSIPSQSPSSEPSSTPSVSSAPSSEPSAEPSQVPSDRPSDQPSSTPSSCPTGQIYIPTNYWVPPLDKPGFTCDHVRVKIPNHGEFACLPVGTGICRDNRGKIGKWRFGIEEVETPPCNQTGRCLVSMEETDTFPVLIDPALTRYPITGTTYRNSITGEICMNGNDEAIRGCNYAGTTHVCIGEDIEANPNKFSNERPYMFFYDEKTNQFLYQLICDGFGEEGKLPQLKMVNNEDHSGATTVKYPLDMVKFKKGPSADATDDNELWKMYVDWNGYHDPATKRHGKLASFISVAHPKFCTEYVSRTEKACWKDNCNDVDLPEAYERPNCNI